jgi:hypothetical protein
MRKEGVKGELLPEHVTKEEKKGRTHQTSRQGKTEALFPHQEEEEEKKKF